MQVPTALAVTVEPLTVQTVGVRELKVTGRPEVAVALAVVVPATLSVGGVKVIGLIVCDPLPVVMSCVTRVAAL